VKRILALTSLWLFAVAALAQAPIGVCLNNVAQTISNGVIAPIPYATVALCTPGSTASNCIANKVNIYTSTSLSTATPTNPFTSDAGGNYFFCAHVGHYGLLINSSYGQYFVPDVAMADNWAAGGTMTGALTDAAGFIGPLTGNATTASASDHSPTQCGAGLYSQGDTTSWAANCAQVLWSQIGSIPSFYYQTVQSAGTALPQQPIINFDATLSAANGTGKTSVGLPSVGTASTYANPTSITTDAQGRVISITGGSSSWTINDCTRVSCAGGSTYAASNTYTNSTSHWLDEYVNIQEFDSTGGCTGPRGMLTGYLNGSPLLYAEINNNSEINNDCNTENISGFDLRVPPGATFKVTIQTISNGATFILNSWHEVVN
jgi:hypothetical protein